MAGTAPGRPAVNGWISPVTCAGVRAAATAAPPLTLPSTVPFASTGTPPDVPQENAPVAGT
ncbi:hypothetical protein [Gluconacetobacter azotocaptans]|uniref:hypothetical protein n=1 Tax=Gluconacetobacter azotocaptans TaxID=142834 RepID=UPI001F041453|nr:hypothetical protein [Gluconacetobacter azotocaptans]